MIGADRHERTDERLGYRNGYRPRSLTTQVGDIELQIPKLRHGPPKQSKCGEIGLSERLN